MSPRAQKEDNQKYSKSLFFLIFKQVWLIPWALFTIFSIELNVVGKKRLSHTVTEKCKRQKTMKQKTVLMQYSPHFQSNTIAIGFLRYTH